MATGQIPPYDPRMMPNPMAPPIAQATPPVFGFQQWASDPMNAHKVQPAMTGPDTPLQPNHPDQQPQQMASSAPPPMAPMASVAPPTMTGTNLATDQAELQRLKQNGAGLNQIHNPLLRGLAKAGDIVAPFILGGGAAAIPGTTLHNRYLQHEQQGRIENDQASIQAAAQLADTQSQTAQRTALGNKADSQADSYAPVTLSAEQAASIGHPELAGESMPSKTYSAMLTGKQRNDSAESIATGKNDTVKSVTATKTDSAEKIAGERNDRMKAIQDAKNKTATMLQGMRSQTSRANTQDRINSKGTLGTAGGHVPADVTKRAALASNVNENADAVEQIVGRNPNIVGATGGRYSNIQQMIGSDDPDIQELGVRMHNIALASNGAHGLRSAEAVAQTEKELFNNFKAGPHGIAGALKGTRQSVQTFLDDEKNFQTSGNRTGNRNNMQPPAAGKTADPMGLR